MREMSDTEIICGWMEPKPTQVIPVGEINDSRWWWRSYPGAVELIPRNLDLDALHEVEARIIERGMADRYRTELVKADAYFWHATAEQKITALAAVLREGETK